MKIKKKYLAFTIAIVFLLIGILFASNFKPKQWQIINGKIKYGDIIVPKIIEEKLVNQSSFRLSRIVFDIRGDKVYTFFLEQDKKVPSILLLGGGSVTKEQEMRAGSALANLGYNVLIPDQRGIGETSGYYPPFETDFLSFEKGLEPIQNKHIYDTLALGKWLEQKGDLIYVGESMGGRFALIAYSLDPKAKVAIGISTSGFHVKDDGSNQAQYFMSIDPDTYLANLNKPLLMLHSLADKTIPINSAKVTAQIAKAEFIELNSSQCAHGFCQPMLPYVEEFLKRASLVP